MIGRWIAGAHEIASNAVGGTADLVRLSYAQAKLLPAEVVRASLDTTDRGSKGSLAKRWYRWFAAADAIDACARSTPAMRARAATARADEEEMHARGLASLYDLYDAREGDRRERLTAGRMLERLGSVFRRVALAETARRALGAQLLDRLAEDLSARSGAAAVVVLDALEERGMDSVTRRCVLLDVISRMRGSAVEINAIEARIGMRLESWRAA